MSGRPVSPSAFADKLDPVPKQLIPQYIQQHEGEVNLFKDEFRAVQRLRKAENIYIPEVVRSTHPPESGPQGVASHPAPSYVSSANTLRPGSGKRAVGVANVARPASGAKRRSLGSFAGKHDWSEREMNVPGVDYVPMRPSSRAPEAELLQMQAKRPTSALDASIQARAQTPMSPAKTLKGRRTMDGTFPPRSPSPGRQEPPRTPISPASPHSPGLLRRRSSASDFIMDVDGCDGLLWGNQLTSLPHVSRPVSSIHSRAGAVEIVSDQTAMDTLNHIKAASSNLRKYSMASQKSATSTTSTTYARKPQPAHVKQPLQASPSERIACNYSPRVRGLSPRLIEYLSPGGIRSDAVGPFVGCLYGVQEAPEISDYTPEADGIVTAARKHMNFLPLELFDNEELETHTPHEWVEMGVGQQGTPAETMYYHLADDKYDWSPCKVLAWDEGQRAFEVLLHTGKRKMVKRLNLRFMDEDNATFQQRIKDARVSREEAEGYLRYVFYLDSLAVEEVIETYNFKGAVENAANGSSFLRPAVVEKHAQQLASEARDCYIRAIRQAIIEYRRLDPYEENRLRVLRLPFLTQLPHVPECGVLDACPGSSRMYNFGRLCAWAPTKLYTSSAIMLPMLQALQGICMSIQQQLLWVFAEQTVEFKTMQRTARYTLQDAGAGPYTISSFEALQHGHAKEVMQYINIKVLEALNSATDENVVAHLHGGYLPSLNDITPIHAALLKHTALKVSNSLHSLLLNSAEAYCKYMEGYEKVHPQHGMYTGLEEVWNKEPLFVLQLADLDGQPTLVPGIEEILDVACGMFDDMAEKLGEIPDVFERKGLSTNRRLCEGNWLADEGLQKYRRRVHDVVQKGVARALEIGSIFEVAATVLGEPIESVLQKLQGDDVGLEQYTALVGRFQSAAAAAANAAYNQVYTGLVVVDCTPLKASLACKGDALVHAVLQHLAEASHNISTYISKRCVEMADRLATLSADTRGVLALQADLESYEIELDELKKVLALNKERDAFLAAYREELPESHFQDSTHASVLVRDMPDVLQRAYMKVNKEHRSFQNALKTKAKDLQTSINLVKDEIKRYNALTDPKEQLEYADLGRKLQAKLQDLEDAAALINEEEALFQWQPTEYPMIVELKTELEPHASLWHITNEFTLAYDSWMYGPFKNLDPDELETLNAEWFKKMVKLSKTMSDPALKGIAESMKAKLEDFRANVPLISCICNPGMRMRHWEAISAAASLSINPAAEGVSLADLLKNNLKDCEQQLQDISDVASREYALEKQLDKMQGEWSGLKFEVLSWKDTGGHILKGSVVEEALMLLDDHTVKAQAMLSSPAAQPFIDRIDNWVKKLQNMQEIFDAWLKCQQMWMYLGPVYGSEEIAKHMPKERREFQAADSKWRHIMNGVVRNPDIVSTTDQEGLLKDLQGCNKSFAVIERSLNAFLDTKKLAFPRFFFLSNDELLEILSETKDPLNVQPFVKKCFEAVRELEFQEDLSITALISMEGERIPLDIPVQAGGEHNGVERWLLNLEGAMQKSLHSITRAAIQAYPTRPREKWVLEWPGQVVLGVGQVFWTSQVVEAIKEGGVSALQRLADQCTADLQQEVLLVRGELSALERCTIGALVVIDVHARDVVREMVHDKVYSETDFSWQARLRYYWEQDTLVVRMLNAQCTYGYEYLGNTGRLVITPLTDRCYRTLLGAHHMNLGGAPAGPAGTGKTETTKDLAKAVAIQCVVFNCSDGLDYLAMGKFFKGLAASGAWACFDEFNRIELEVLSVVAQQVLTIQRAKAAAKKRFLFEGVDLPLVPTCNVFITMNPGYAGRSELPDNLKALFRDVAMMVPDYAMIAEIILYSYGYLDARSLAQKLVQTYRLCSEQLSKQDHYDYGMRAVMAVLRAAGNLKRRYQNEQEDMLMLRAIDDVNLPKFLDEDVPLFKGILSDLFPGVNLPAVDYADLSAALTSNAIKANLQALPSFIEKSIQLYEMIVVRHGLMLVGQSFGMKTVALRTLAAALGDLCAEGKKEQKVKMYTINPKSVWLGQLYGQDDPVSKEWTDGILAVAFRNAARDTSPDRKWLVLDGPVDAIWIENMNTVLDDNKKLCLNSGEIIAMQGLMNLIFEVADLAVASPATVSRCGMVYVQPSLLGWRPLVQSWMATLPESFNKEYRGVILTMFDWLVPPTLRLVIKDCNMPVNMQDINMVQSLIRLYQALLDENKAGLASDPLLYIESLFIFAAIWTLGGAVDAAGRERFSTHFRLFLAGQYDEAYRPYATGASRKLTKMLPDQHTVYDWFFNNSTGKWQGWMESVKGQKIPADVEYSSIIVNTLDVVRYTYLVQTLVAHHLPVLLVGPTGTGKTVYIKRHLATLDRKLWVPIIFNFSAQTSSNTTQDIIDGKLEKRRKGIYGPPIGRHAVVFVDDLNMPQVEKYGAQPPIELLRQFMDHGGWYDRTELSIRHIVDTQFVSAMGPPGGGRNPVTNRYLRHFHVLFATEFGDESKTQIFTALVDWWFTRCKYKEDISFYRDNLVAASLEIYSAAVQELLPTPAKTHYTFNLRDLSKVFQGMQEAGANLQDNDALIRLWVHEVMRVFHDRLVDDADRQWLISQLKTTTENHFHLKFQKLLSRVASEEGHVGVPEMRKLMFVEFLAGAGVSRYEEVTDLTKLTATVEEQLADFNAASRKPMRLVLFLYALEHVARVCRILRQPAGHALLVGVGGSGRQSLTRLAAFILEYQVAQIELSSSYTKSDWQDDLRKALRQAGEKAKPTVFLFSDSQILEESMVEDISNLLNTAEVPNLFDVGEMISIAEGVRSRAKAAKVPDTRQDMYDFFVQQVRRNFHVVLCFSPVGDAFRERLRKFPSLVTCTTIDWFTVWPDDALQSVATRALADLSVPDELKHKLAEQCMHFHGSVRELTTRYLKEARRNFYVTPTSYLQLLDTFQSILLRRQQELQSAQRQYENGLAKLAATELQVKQMQLELEELKPQLIVSGQETAKLMKVIEKETREADKVKLVVQVEERKAQQEAAKVQAIKDDCEADLAEAMPAYNSAIKSLDTLTKNDVSEVKGMKNPPLPVKLVMEAVCLLKGLKPMRLKDKDTGQFVLDWWETSKKVLSDMYFLESLKTYDKDNIAPEIMDAVRPYISKADFQPAKMKKVSQAAFGLCNWVRAMEQYDRVAKVVRPKKAALKEAEAQLAVVMQALKVKQDELKSVEAKLATLDTQLQAATAKKATLEKDVALCEEKLDRANKLTGGLGGEKARWTEAAHNLAEQQIRLVGDMLLSAGAIAYLGAFTSEYRHQIIQLWQEQCGEKAIPCTHNFTLVGALGDPVRLRSWNIWGLPKDDFSAANGVMVAESKRWPLCIDPQGQALKWITNMEAANNLVVLKPGSANYLRQLEAAIGLGRPVLIAGVGETLDAALEPVLLQQTFKQGGMLCIKLGDSVVTWSPGFKLYLTTKLRNPHYPPEVCVRVCLVNFMITPMGLQEQLLGLTVAKERPDLEKEKNELILQGAENKRKLKEIEQRILAVLEESQGNILEDGAAVTVLQESKTIADEIARRQKEAERTEAAIDNARVAYQPVARHASVLFFCMAELVNIDPMYQYSLTYFTSLFARSIDESPPNPSLPKRLESLKQRFTHFLFTNICRSLFEKDKLLFAFSLANSLALAAGHLELPLLKFLLAGGVSMNAPEDNPAKEWLSDKGWADLCHLDTLGAPFTGIRASLAGMPEVWRKQLNNTRLPAAEQFPEPHATDLTAFQKLLVLRCLAPEKLTPAIQAYVVEQLGKEYVQPQPLQLGAAYSDSSPQAPLIFVLSQGSDPMAELLKFADEKHRQVETVSLGQGQGPNAEHWVREAAKSGFWVVLQNCHLAASFLPRLEALCEEVLHSPSTHAEFRLWLTSYPTDIFPISILESGLKMTYELPAGLRAGLTRIYKSDPLCDKGFLEGCANESAFKCLVYSLAFFHCVVTGRRQYGPVGWNIPYSFNENDLRISMRQLRLFLDTYEDVPLTMLQYTAGECNYGGKVTDAQDRRTLSTILSGFYCDASVLPGFPLAAKYVIPKTGSHAHYLDHISDLPLTEAPEVFGLHPNAAISRDLQATRTLLDSLLLTLPQSATSQPSAPSNPDAVPKVVQTPEDMIHSVASEILGQLPADFNLEAAAEQYPVTYLDSMNTVLVQELGRVNTLLAVIRSSLEDVRLAVRGRVVMSAELERLASALLNGKVPEMWLARSFPSLKPLGPYIRELLERTAFFAKWLRYGPPACFWISAFFFTQAFLTGVKQNFARRHRIPIDLIEFTFLVMDEEGQCGATPEDGAYVSGMFLEAASWDYSSHLLTESKPKLLHVPMPPMHFLPAQLPPGVAAGQGEGGDEEGWYVSPLYKTSERRGVLSTTGHSTNYVMGVRLQTQAPAAHWVKRGVALLTSLDT